MLSPAWFAVRLHVPAPLVMVTVVPLIEQAPEAPSVTASPELAVAVTVKVLLKPAVAGAPVKVMVWFNLAMLNVCETGAAAL